MPFGARNYLPEIGQFDAPEPLPVDPTRLGTLLPYAYAFNNPVALADTDGRCAVPGAIVGAVAGGLIGGGIALWRQVAGDEEGIDWNRVAEMTAVAATSGGLAGATCGASLIVTIGGGALLATAGDVGVNAALGHVKTPEEIGETLALSVAGGAVGAGVARGVGTARDIISLGSDDIAQAVSRQFAEEAAESAARVASSASRSTASSAAQGARVGQTAAAPSSQAAARGGGGGRFPSDLNVRSGGGATLETSNLTVREAQRIRNAANRLGGPITVVGSRAKGTLKPTSDYDYVIETTGRQRRRIGRSLPGAKSVREGLPNNQDLFPGPVDPDRPFITFDPR
jgi:hypothetical protein